jgi:hypothetical protein
VTHAETHATAIQRSPMARRLMAGSKARTSLVVAGQ